MNPIRVLDSATSFRPIHFAALLPSGETHIFVWRNLDYTLETLKELVPDVWPFLTADHVRGLASPEWDEESYGNRLSHDEFVALWFAKTVYDQNIAFPDRLEDLYDADGAAKHAKRLMLGEHKPVVSQDTLLSQWQHFVKTMVTSSTKHETNIIRRKKVRQTVPETNVRLCKNCGVPPIVEVFRHAPPNWMVHCPSCGIATDPREGYERETAIEAWNKGN
jgi:hypothetical protein